MPDIATIPPVIDAAYLNRVLAALDEVEAEAIGEVVATRSLTIKADQLFNAIYSDDWFSEVARAWAANLGRNPNLPSVRRPVGPRHTLVERLISSSPECVWMAVRRDYSDAEVNPRPVQTEYMALAPLDRSNDPGHRNATAWMITANGLRKDRTEPDDPCPRR